MGGSRAGPSRVQCLQARGYGHASWSIEKLAVTARQVAVRRPFNRETNTERSPCGRCLVLLKTLTICHVLPPDCISSFSPSWPLHLFILFVFLLSMLGRAIVVLPLFFKLYVLLFTVCSHFLNFIVLFFIFCKSLRICPYLPTF